MLLFKRILPVALTMSIGVLVMISFLPLDPANSLSATLINMRAVLVEWAVILAAAALVLGFVNLIGVHFRRIRQSQGIGYSIALIAASALALGYWVGSMLIGKRPPTQALDELFNSIIAPAQSALGALLAILIAVAGFRALRLRRSVGMFLFVLSAIVVVITQPVSFTLFGRGFGGLLEFLRVALIDPITTGSLRGLLLGVALGSVAVGLRLLVGADRPQGD